MSPELQLITLPKRDVVSLLEWAWRMPGFHLREDAKRLMAATGMTSDACEGDPKVKVISL